MTICSRRTLFPVSKYPKTATLVHPKNEAEFYEMIHLFIMLMVALGMSSATIVMNFPRVNAARECLVPGCERLLGRGRR